LEGHTKKDSDKMAKEMSGDKKTTSAKTIKKILVSQARPESDKSPYFDLEKKYNVSLFFQPLIQLVPIPAKEFRKSKIDIAEYSAVIFTSKNAIDHFFRTCDELKVSINQDTKYFCITESVALYLQKFIMYRKRKVFFGADGTNKKLFDVLNKHKANERFLYVCSENQQDNEIVNWLKDHTCKFDLGYMYRSESTDIKKLMADHKFDVICLFTPSGLKSLYDNQPDFKQNGTALGAFGSNTCKAIAEAGLQLHIQVPSPQIPSMVAGLDQFLALQSKKK
jgi:uroporphyrinogen-III synthase